MKYIVENEKQLALLQRYLEILPEHIKSFVTTAEKQLETIHFHIAGGIVQKSNGSLDLPVGGKMIFAPRIGKSEFAYYFTPEKMDFSICLIFDFALDKAPSQFYFV